MESWTWINPVPASNAISKLRPLRLLLCSLLAQFVILTARSGLALIPVRIGAFFLVLLLCFPIFVGVLFPAGGLASIRPLPAFLLLHRSCPRSRSAAG